MQCDKAGDHEQHHDGQYRTHPDHRRASTQRCRANIAWIGFGSAEAAERANLRAVVLIGHRAQSLSAIILEVGAYAASSVIFLPSLCIGSSPWKLLTDVGGQVFTHDIEQKFEKMGCGLHLEVGDDGGDCPEETAG